MINLPHITLKRQGTMLSVTVTMYGNLLVDRNEWLTYTAQKYLASHQDLSRHQIICYLLKLIKDKDFVIFEFGGKPLHYVQFIKTGENLDFDFPYSIKLGTRFHMVDRVELILKRHGFSRFVTPFTLKTLHYSDHSYNSMVMLDASFGIRKYDLAAKVTLDIAKEIFRSPANGKLKYKLGTQRDFDS